MRAPASKRICQQEGCLKQARPHFNRCVRHGGFTVCQKEGSTRRHVVRHLSVNDTLEAIVVLLMAAASRQRVPVLLVAIMAASTVVMPTDVTMWPVVPLTIVSNMGASLYAKKRAALRRQKIGE